MNFRNNFTKIVFFTLFCLLIGGLIYNQTAYSKDLEQAKKESAQPVTDCFESIEHHGVGRIENIDSPYGFPNVKCSQRTGAVLWYGDPYDGTKPMGDMPKLKDDDTHGEYETEEAVVKPRVPVLENFECIECHDGDTVPVPEDKNPRELDAHEDIVENSLQIMHGRGTIWCFDCHSATNRNKLVNQQGDEISFDQPQRLCGGCHGSIYSDWRVGIHGKRTGSWATGGKKRWWVCTECHSPHTVQTKRFDLITPEPAPAFPRGMDHAHEGHEGGDGGEEGSPQESASASGNPSKGH